MIHFAKILIFFKSSRNKFRQSLFVLCFICFLSVLHMAYSTEEQGDNLSQNDAGSTIQLQPVDAEDYHRLLSEYRDKIVVVDFWATWCPPCVASFPKLVEMATEFREKEVIVIGASVDFPGTEEKVKEFLHRHKADFPQLFVATKNIDAFIKSVSTRWDGSVPVIFVYNRDGSIAGQYSGDVAIEQAKEKIRDIMN